MINNATPHDYSGQQYACDFTGCSSYFRGRAKSSNAARATLLGLDVLLFRLEERSDGVDVFISIPDDFLPTHYFRGVATPDEPTKNAHLTYHGSPKRKKMSGEIHLVSSGLNSFSGVSNRVSAPLAFSSEIESYPLPICRLELNLRAGSLKSRKDTQNFFEIHPGDVFFNTIEVHLARSGFLHSVASCSPTISPLLGSIFINTSMHLFFLNKMESRPGLFPQALALQTRKYELVILATHEHKNSEYQENSVRYFHTEDYFRNLVLRNCQPHADGWFVDLKPDYPLKPGFVRLSSLVKS